MTDAVFQAEMSRGVGRTDTSPLYLWHLFPHTSCQRQLQLPRYFCLVLYRCFVGHFCLLSWVKDLCSHQTVWHPLHMRSWLIHSHWFSFPVLRLWYYQTSFIQKLLKCYKNKMFNFILKKIEVCIEPWVKNGDTNRIMSLVFRYSPTASCSQSLRLHFNPVQVSSTLIWKLPTQSAGVWGAHALRHPAGQQRHN